MVHYCQADPRWSNRILGRNKTFKQAGCAVTCISMIASESAGSEVTPDKIDDYLDKHQGYQGDSIIWDKAVEAITHFGGDIHSWEHVSPESYDPASAKYAIMRVKTAHKSLHYICQTEQPGVWNDPAHKDGVNISPDQYNYEPDRVTIFC